LSQPLVELLGNGVPSTPISDPVHHMIQEALARHGHKAKSIAMLASPCHGSVAYVADCSSFMGMIKTHVVGYGTAGQEFSLFHKPCTGILREGAWNPKQ
jgi:hypothetical protein